MSDDLTKRHPHDGKKVNVNQAHELRDWADKLGVTPDKLKDIVKKVGPNVDDIKHELDSE